MSFDQLTYSKPLTTSIYRRLARMVCTLLATSLSMHSLYAGDEFDDLSLWQKIPDQELSKMRGGFVTSDGLSINVGLERLVMIDGTVKTQFNFDLSGLGQNSNKSSSLPSDQNNMIQLIQNGDNNLVTQDVPANFGGGALTIIQNSQDNKLIQNFTMLQIDVSGMSQFRTNSLGKSISIEQIRALH
jgi:hypothetical protein